MLCPVPASGVGRLRGVVERCQPVGGCGVGAVAEEGEVGVQRQSERAGAGGPQSRLQDPLKRDAASPFGHALSR
jgi:hypothetical protein